VGADLFYNIVQLLPFSQRVTFVDTTTTVILSENKITAEYLGDNDVNRIVFPIKPFHADKVIGYIGDDTFGQLTVNTIINEGYKPPSYVFGVFKPTDLSNRHKLLLFDLVKHYYSEVLVKVLNTNRYQLYRTYTDPYGFQHLPSASMDIPIVKVVDEDGQIHIVDEWQLIQLQFNLRCLCLNKTCKTFLNHIGKPNKKGMFVIIEKISAFVDTDYENLSHTQVDDVTIIYVT
jgi:hypothetical protein